MTGSESPLILVADDDKQVRDHFQALLTKEGYRVVLAADGREAVAQVRACKPDLVILDVVMPGLDGLEVCRILKSRQNDSFLPVIILTSRDDMNSRVAGLRLGADDYLAKPPNTPELMARMEALLRIKKLQDRITSSLNQAKDQAVTDPETGLYNERYFMDRLRDEFKRAERYSEPLSCIMIELDDFHAIMASHGKESAQMILKEVADIVRKKVREFDVVARHDENRFVVLLPRTHFTGSLAVAARVWQHLHGHRFELMQVKLGLEASFGVSFFPNKDVLSADNMIQQASLALVEAKKAGKRQICLFQHTTYFYRPDMGS